MSFQKHFNVAVVLPYVLMYGRSIRKKTLALAEVLLHEGEELRRKDSEKLAEFANGLTVKFTGSALRFRKINSGFFLALLGREMRCLAEHFYCFNHCKFEIGIAISFHNGYEFPHKCSQHGLRNSGFVLPEDLLATATLAKSSKILAGYCNHFVLSPY